MGRNKYSQAEIDAIGKLLKRKASGTRFQQKQIRHILRTGFEFNISDFGVQGQAFGYEELQECIKRKRILILDDATIEDMKAKRALIKQKEMAEKAEEQTEVVDWQEAMRQWEEWEKSQENEKEVQN
ncbi:MAG: hypothetical protein KBT03_06515 [Bacteroidales bacterium]|nr:hypothetical protein [Candidatus Scybalousia scybalohippi]MCQ2326254.1 hypothetical protein [Bacteroidales bacterium]